MSKGRKKNVTVKGSNELDRDDKLHGFEFGSPEFATACKAAFGINLRECWANGSSNAEWYARQMKRDQFDIRLQMLGLLKAHPFPAGLDLIGKVRHMRGLVSAHLAPAGETFTVVPQLPAAAAFPDGSFERWKSDPALQQEFVDFAGYEAYAMSQVSYWDRGLMKLQKENRLAEKAAKAFGKWHADAALQRRWGSLERFTEDYIKSTANDW